MAALDGYADYTANAFEKFQDSIQKCENLVLDESVDLKRKTHYNFAKFLEKILRAHEN